MVVIKHNAMKKVMLVFGTRPEAIKMAPIVIELKKYSDKFQTIVVVTGQHRQMLDQVLNLFEIVPDYDLNIMKSGQDLTDITCRVLTGLRDIYRKENPNIVLVHGDTTTSMAAALAAFYQQIPVGHIEAGLRTHNIYSPWPEEMNRQITGRISSYHFAPTDLSKQNLINENVSNEKIIVTGNTVIDALHLVINKINSSSEIELKTKMELLDCGYDVERLGSEVKLVLITGHRRENFGEGFLSICKAIKTLASRFPTVDFVYPMHLNPNVRNPITEIFGNHLNELGNLFFIEPLDYLPFVYLMNKANILLTDSGGIQEEAPGLGKPVLVMRDTTERPEAVDAGTVRLVGTSYDKITQGISHLLEDIEEYNVMSKAVNPYGDGNASKRIIEFLDIIL